MYDDAIFAKAAYDYTAGVPVSNFDLDKDLSNDDMSVWYNPVEKRAVVSYRGTRPTNAFDLAADFAIAKNAQKYHPRFHRAAKLARKAVNKYGKDNVRLTGHSLGGSLALYANESLGDDAVETSVFNPGHSLEFDQHLENLGKSRTDKGKKLKSKTRIYAHNSDLVSKGFHSRLNPYQVYIMKDKKGGALEKHGLQTFLNSREDDFYSL